MKIKDDDATRDEDLDAYDTTIQAYYRKQSGDGGRRRIARSLRAYWKVQGVRI
ncbi:MAG: hypothetical protein BSOLF_1377 [Candidatus Carbobacillus altaicus]|uniref:Uncharacterized protein n=1 Tax=Candidatus Carbonibacillus altaicus TaxID=2163959 RepID=A0A2R6Y487_9BACL|nr:MAG: hypothetical protein BSOLF_1377 [Candidatus Carbobacillus altaicus]